MTKLMSVLLTIAFAATLQAQQTFHSTTGKLPTEIVSKTVGLNPEYLVYSSRGVEAKVPLVIYLHGAGGVGKEINKIHGQTGGIRRYVETKGSEPVIVIAPQCFRTKDGPEAAWLASDLNVWLAHLKATLPVDEDRVYLTGTSMGGYGTWMWAAANPEHFAAVAPVCGGLGSGGPKDITPDFDRWAKQLATVPLWAFHGGKDRVVPSDRSERMVQAIKDHGGKNAKLTVYPDLGHGISRETYSDAAFYKWLQSHKKSGYSATELQMAQRGELLMAESFDGKDLPERFKTGTGDWSIHDGVLRGHELESSHHSAFRKLFLDHQDVVYQVDLRIEGEATARFMINYELVHVANCFANKDEFTFTKLAEHKKRKAMEELAKRSNQPVEQGDWQQKSIKFTKPNDGFREGKWYTLTIELVGDEALAHLDGQTVYAKHAGLAERKTNFGLQAVGLEGSVSYDNLKVWSATEDKQWPKRRERYQTE